MPKKVKNSPSASKQKKQNRLTLSKKRSLVSGAVFVLLLLIGVLAGLLLLSKNSDLRQNAWSGPYPTVSLCKVGTTSCVSCPGFPNSSCVQTCISSNPATYSNRTCANGCEVKNGVAQCVAVVTPTVTPASQSDCNGISTCVSCFNGSPNCWKCSSPPTNKTCPHRCVVDSKTSAHCE